jgi:HD-GYP domain-containing protein (c-di-GMP phosphodiesterase class II)
MFESAHDHVSAYLRRISIQDAAIGMYVQELDRPWTDTPFLFQGLRIRNAEELQTLKEYCEFVYIDRERGIDLPQTRLLSGSSTSSPVPHIMKIANCPHNGIVYPDTVGVEEELDAATSIYQNSYRSIEKMFDVLRQDGVVSMHELRETSNDIVASVLRNPDAFMLLQKLKCKDDYSYTHAVNSSALAASFCRHLGFTRDEIKDIALGALVLDIGIIKLPESILEKSGPLNPISRKLIKHHVGFSLEMLDRITGMPPYAREMVATHHERLNGNGYPDGLEGQQIPLCGRIAAIVDCYDAMISKRPYKRPLSPSQAICELYKWRNIDFHEDLVEQFIQCLGAYPTGTLVELNSGQVGIVLSQNRLRRLYPRLLLILNSDKVHYEKPLVLDLWEHAQRSRGKTLDIKRAIDPETLGIDPADYYL